MTDSELNELLERDPLTLTYAELVICLSKASQKTGRREGMQCVLTWGVLETETQIDAIKQAIEGMKTRFTVNEYIVAAANLFKNNFAPNPQ